MYVSKGVRERVRVRGRVRDREREREKSVCAVLCCVCCAVLNPRQRMEAVAKAVWPSIMWGAPAWHPTKNGKTN